MKGLIKALAVALAFIFMLGGCSFGGKGALRYDIDEPLSTFDPQSAKSTSELLVAANCFEGLVKLNLDGECVPAAAKEWSISNDALEYVFTLNEDMLWSDEETAVTAGDFVFAFKRLFDPNTKAPLREEFYSIKNSEKASRGQVDLKEIGVRAKDSHTLVITLERADPFFLARLASPAAAPCNEKFFMETRGRYGNSVKYTLSNGPFTLTNVNEGVSYRLSRFNDYYGETPAYKRVSLYVKGSEGYSALQRLLDEEIDAAPVSFSDLPELRREKFIITEDRNIVWVLKYNTENEFLASTDIRRAIFYSTDRDYMIDKLPGNLTVAKSYVPPAVCIGGESYRSRAGEEFSGFDYDPAFARTLLDKGLEELGEKKLGTLTVLCPEEYLPLLGGMQASVQENLAAFINIKCLPIQDIEKQVTAGNYDIALMPLTLSYDSPGEFFTMSGVNKTTDKSTGERINTTLEKANRAKSIEEAVDYYATAEQLLLQYMPLCPMFFESSYFAVANGIGGLEYSPFGSHISFYYAK